MHKMKISIFRPMKGLSVQRISALTGQRYLQQITGNCSSLRILESCTYPIQRRRAIHHTPSLPSAPKKVRVRKTPGPVEHAISLPPIQILRTAHKSELLPIEPEAVLEFLTELQTESSTHAPGWDRRVCLKYNIDPWILGIIASILDKSETPGQRRFGRDLLFTAASFGDRASSFKLVYAATKQGRLHDVVEPLRQVALLAKTGDDPQAMTLLGMALFSQGNEDEALIWLRNASAGSLDFPGAADALVLEGRILMSQDKEGAKAALQRAANELDDPNAYFYLSMLQPNGSVEHEMYLAKAAASGVLEACHNLGVAEMAKISNGRQRPRSLPEFGLALDWTEIAAEGGFGLSMLNMALMCGNVGLRKEGLQWLDRAEKDVKVRDEAKVLKKRWESADTLQD